MNQSIIRIINSAESGGIRQSEFQFSNRLVKRGYAVIQVVLNDDGSFPAIAGAKQIKVAANIHDYRGKPLRKVSGFIANHTQTYRNVAKRVISDIISCQAEVLVVNTRKVIQVPLALAIARALDCRVLFHPGDSNHNKSGLIKKYYARLGKHKRITFIANSAASAASFGLAANQFVYPGFDSTRLPMLNDSKALENKSRQREILGLPQDRVVLLFMARVEVDKAPDILIEAFHKSGVAKSQNAILVLVGIRNFSDPFVEKLKNMVKTFGLEQNVMFERYSNNVAVWFSAADLFVNSRRGFEPFGISIVEALHCGLPVISSAYGGPEETVQHGKTGWLVRELDVAGFAEAIKRAFSERAKWPDMSQAAIESSAQFNIDAQVDRYLSFVHNGD